MTTITLTDQDTALLAMVHKRFLDDMMDYGAPQNLAHAKATQACASLAICHTNHKQLDFQKLLGFDAMDFNEEMIGIDRDMDRVTEKLKGIYQLKCVAKLH